MARMDKLGRTTPVRRWAATQFLLRKAAVLVRRRRRRALRGQARWIGRRSHRRGGALWVEEPAAQVRRDRAVAGEVCKPSQARQEAEEAEVPGAVAVAGAPPAREAGRA